MLVGGVVPRISQQGGVALMEESTQLSPHFTAPLHRLGPYMLLTL